MPDRETDDDERAAAAAVGLGAADGADPAGSAGASSAKAGQAVGDPSIGQGAGQGLGQPGVGPALGDPSIGQGAGQAFGNPSIGQGAGQGIGQPGAGPALGDPSIGQGAGQAIGNPSVGQSAGQTIGDPGAGPPPGDPSLGPPPGQPGLGPPAGQPGVAQPGPWISIKSVLIGVAAIVAAIIAAIAAFFVLRPDLPQQTAEQQSRSTGGDPTVGSTSGTAATPSEPLFRGTYSSHVTVTSIAGTTTNDNIGTVTSDCPRCDVTLSGSGASTTFHWNGGAWEHITTGPICAGDPIAFTPTVVADGFVQELSYYYATCNGTVSSGTMTRIGD